MLDPAKLVYGQGFAIYALAVYGAAAHDDDALRLACETFDLLHVHAVDATYGGYLENLDSDWTPFAAPPGESERKSLDIHMHLLEAFTELAVATADATHLRRLSEVRELILTRMIDPLSGVGGNQYDRQFRPLDPVVIDRTWIAERTTPEQRGPFAPSTSYGHNLELGWLLMRCGHGSRPDPAVRRRSRVGPREPRTHLGLRREQRRRVSRGPAYRAGDRYRQGVLAERRGVGRIPRGAHRDRRRPLPRRVPPNLALRPHMSHPPVRRVANPHGCEWSGHRRRSRKPLDRRISHGACHARVPTAT